MSIFKDKRFYLAVSLPIVEFIITGYVGLVSVPVLLFSGLRNVSDTAVIKSVLSGIATVYLFFVVPVIVGLFLN